MTPILVFDIETVPDIAGIRRVHDLARRRARRRRAWRGSRSSDARRPAAISRRCYLQKVVAIACALREGASLARVVGRRARRSRARAHPALLRRHREATRRSSCRGTAAASTCRCCNHRALIHGVAAAKYWDWGDDDREFKFNNYLGRYHTRHLDLMDVLAMYQPRASAGLDAMARLCGFPGKIGMDGSEVAAAVARRRARRRAQLLRDAT